MRNTTKLIIAFASGLATGALLGILFAPDKGENTRKKLSFELEKYLAQLNELITGTKKNADNSAEEAHSDLSPQDYKKAEDLLKEVESLLDDIKNKTN